MSGDWSRENRGEEWITGAVHMSANDTLQHSGDFAKVRTNVKTFEMFFSFEWTECKWEYGTRELRTLNCSR